MILRHLLVAISTAALLLAAAAPARAQGTVTCLNCATWMDYDQKWVWDGIQWAKNLEQQVLQVQQEIQTAVNTLNFYKNAVQNTINLPLSVYRDVTNDVRQIEGIISQGAMLQGYSKQMLANLTSVSGYPDSLIVDWRARLVQENQALSLAMTTAAQVIGDQGPQRAANAATFARLQQEAMANDGHQKSLQTIAGTNASIGQMLQTNQQTEAATQQAMMTYFTKQADRQLLLDGYNDLMYSGAFAGDCIALAQLGVAPPEECSKAGVLGSVAAAGGSPNTGQ